MAPSKFQDMNKSAELKQAMGMAVILFDPSMVWPIVEFIKTYGLLLIGAIGAFLAGAFVAENIDITLDKPPISPYTNWKIDENGKLQYVIPGPKEGEGEGTIGAGLYAGVTAGVLSEAKAEETDKEVETEKKEEEAEERLPENAQNAYDKYKKSGWSGNVPGQTSGTKAGGKYDNEPEEQGDQKLPETDANGNKIEYKEWDVNNKVPGATRDDERFVTGSDGSVYYTDDHYHTFTQIE